MTRTAEPPLAINEHDKGRRAELAAELGAGIRDLDDESIARHRADAARKKTDRDPAKRWAHLTELARQRDAEQRGREGGRRPVRVSRDVNEGRPSGALEFVAVDPAPLDARSCQTSTPTPESCC